MATNRAKRRDRSQRIGRQGENIFDTWATRNHLVANKQDEDFGIDFVCHEAEQITARTEEVTGRSVHVQVRASSGDEKPRVTVDRVDVETALRQEAPYCLVAVRMKNESVHFRFLDEVLALEWANFLTGTAKTTSLALGEMDNDPEKFIRELRRVSRPAFRAKFARVKAQNALSAVMPGSRLHVNSGLGGDWALVATSKAEHIFDLKNAKEREQLAKVVFSPGRIEDAVKRALDKFKLKPALTRLADLTDGPIMLTVPLEEEVTLSAQCKDQAATASARLRRVEDERAYVLESGLVIRVSDAVRGEDGRYFHGLSSDIVEEGARSLAATADLAFLKALAPGAQFNERGRPGIPVEEFRLESIGPAIAAIEAVYSVLEIPLTEAKLADLTDRVFASNLGVLEALLVKKPDGFAIPGFVFGIPSDQPLEEDKWVSCAYQVPIVMRMRNRTVAVWLTGEGAAYIPEGTILGYRFGPPVEVDAQVADFEAVGDGSAAAYVVDDWPALPLDPTGREMLVRRTATLPVQGTFVYDPKHGPPDDGPPESTD